MSHQVEVPVRITVIAALGGHQHYPVIVMTGAVSMVERGRPDLGPTVCNLTTGIPRAEPSTWPPLRCTMARWTRLMVFRLISARYCYKSVA
jgi:hypothetical protein